MFSLVRKLIGLAILVVIAYAGFRWGPLVFPRLERALGMNTETPATPSSGAEPSPEIADATLDRFERFRAGEGGGRLALSGPELSSVLRYALPGMVPPGVSDPSVSLENGRVVVRADVAVAAFPNLPRMDQVIGLLPDTVAIAMEGALVPFDQSNLALLIERVEAAGIPVPRRMFADMLAGLGRSASPSLPKDAMAVPMPDGVESVFVQGDSLVLVARR